jgi:hypothetical protein
VAADEDDGGGQQWGQTATVAVDDKDMQDQVADYNREKTPVASDAGESRVGMMAVMVENGGSR